MDEGSRIFDTIWVWGVTFWSGWFMMPTGGLPWFDDQAVIYVEVPPPLSRSSSLGVVPGWAGRQAGTQTCLGGKCLHQQKEKNSLFLTMAHWPPLAAVGGCFPHKTCRRVGAIMTLNLYGYGKKFIGGPPPTVKNFTLAAILAAIGGHLVLGQGGVIFCPRLELQSQSGIQQLPILIFRESTVLQILPENTTAA